LSFRTLARARIKSEVLEADKNCNFDSKVPKTSYCT
jgi:hypothetical protein